MIVLRFAWTYPGEFLSITLGAEPCYFQNSNSNAYFGEIGEQFSSEFAKRTEAEPDNTSLLSSR